MPLTHNTVIDQLLMPALFVFLLVAGIAGVALGFALIVSRGRVVPALGALNHWVSGSRPLAALEMPHTIEPTIHRYRRWFGAVFIIAAAFSLIMLFARLSVAGVITLLGASSRSPIAAWLVESLGWMLLVGSVLALAIGILLGFFPQLLATLEAHANRWYSSRGAIDGADRMVLSLDKWAESSPRTAGWVIATAALALAVNSAIVLGHRWTHL
jgi:hypothetical protein